MKGRRPDTELVHGGRRKAWTQGIVNTPVWRASTVVFDTVAEMEATYPPREGHLHYARSGTPTTWTLCEALTQLEPQGAGTWLYPSGLAAVANALLSVLRTGDEVLIPDNVFGPTRRFCERTLRRFGIIVTYYDPLAGSDIEASMSAATKAIFLESPGSITMEVQDVPAICAVAAARGVVSVMDNTWATSLLFPALSAGIDISIVACTKYVGGHSDAMLGAVTANAAFWPAVRESSQVCGQIASPDDAYLVTRGLRTLGVRMARQGESALAIARWLQEQPQVAKVLHPALDGCPGHEIWKRDFLGSSGLFSFILNGGSETECSALIDRLSLFAKGYSWGGFESLAIGLDPAKHRKITRWTAPGPLIRVSVGLEDVHDLIEDLALGLHGYPV